MPSILLKPAGRSQENFHREVTLQSHCCTHFLHRHFPILYLSNYCHLNHCRLTEHLNPLTRRFHHSMDHPVQQLHHLHKCCLLNWSPSLAFSSPPLFQLSVSEELSSWSLSVVSSSLISWSTLWAEGSYFPNTFKCCRIMNSEQNLLSSSWRELQGNSLLLLDLCFLLVKRFFFSVHAVWKTAL